MMKILAPLFQSICERIVITDEDQLSQLCDDEDEIRYRNNTGLVCIYRQGQADLRLSLADEAITFDVKRKL